MGLRSDDQTGCSYSKRGETPVLPGSGQRFGCNLISTISNHVTVHFKLFTQNFDGEVMLEFLHRLIERLAKVMLESCPKFLNLVQPTFRNHHL